MSLGLGREKSATKSYDENLLVSPQHHKAERNLVATTRHREDKKWEEEAA